MSDQLANRYYVTGYGLESDNCLTVTLAATGPFDTEQIHLDLLELRYVTDPDRPPINRHHYRDDRLAARPCNDARCGRPHGQKPRP